MGLDISAYSNTKPVLDHAPKGEDGCEDYDHVLAIVYDNFPRSFRGLLADPNYLVGSGLIGGICYDTSESEYHGFRAGSYGGHNVFRERIAALLDLEPGDYWRGGDEEWPFYEFVNFADNEGCIGPDAAADLLEDFRTYRDAFEEAHADDLDLYDDWIRACELASDGGLIEFH